MSPRVSYVFPSPFRWGVALRSIQMLGPAPQGTWRTTLPHPSPTGWEQGYWKEDLERAAEAGIQVVGLYLSWPRLEPEPGQWDSKTLSFFQEMLAHARKLGLETWLAFHDGEEPRWFHAQEGWLRGEAPKRFVAYVNHVAQTLHPWVTAGWCPLPEPNRWAWEGYITGDHPPKYRKRWPQALVALGHMLEAHARSAQTLRRIAPHIPRFLSLALCPDIRLSPPWHPLLRKVQGQAWHLLHQVPMRALRGMLKNDVDILGLAILSPLKIHQGILGGWKAEEDSPQPLPPTAHPREGALFHLLKWVRQAGKPLWITRHGLDDPLDTLRPSWLLDQLLQVWHGFIYGATPLGFLYDSLVDGFDPQKGWLNNGLWAVDRENLQRRERPSAHLYRDLIRHHGITHDLVATHVPERLPQLYLGLPWKTFPASPKRSESDPPS